MHDERTTSLNLTTPADGIDAHTPGHSIQGMFAEQAARHPTSVAAILGERCLTYAELDRKSNQLASFLRHRGAGADQLVGLCMQRNLEMIVGLLGILKAGGAYLPLDPNYPIERLRYMLADAAPRLVLGHESSRTALSATRSEAIWIDTSWSEIAGHPDTSPQIREQQATGLNLVYVIYTSGSTGIPKGTAMTHGSMVNLLQWHNQSLPIRPGLRVLQFAALSFDVAFQEIFTTLCAGGTLVLLDEWVRKDARALIALLNSQRIQRLFLPPLMLQSIAESSGTTGVVPTLLEDIITAGEQLRITSQIADMFKQMPACRLHNHYGPTETHVVTSLTLSGNSSEWPQLPTIGQPISNTQIHILDAHREEVERGEIGEIYIGGANVARGYLRRPELTAERFVALGALGRCYKTGDLGRWSDNGTIEFLGRNDDQVKLRGFRIELGEIETRLSRHELVKDAVVTAREDLPGQKRLVAYVTTRSEPGPSVEALRQHLKDALPDYMVPSAFVRLDHLPVTPNGKLDRRALPAPTLEAYGNRVYEAPQNFQERALAEVWQEVLRVETVGRSDNFFELGGDSILMVQMLERLRRKDIAVADVRAIFQSQTLAELATSLTPQRSASCEIPPNRIPDACAAIEPEMLTLVQLTRDEIATVAGSVPGGMPNIQDIYPLAPLQEGILFHHLLNDNGGDTYVLPITLQFSSRERLQKFVGALQTVIDRHDILRTAILWEKLPRAVQVVHRLASLSVETFALDTDINPLEQIAARAALKNQRLDLRQAPLVRLQIAADPHSAQWYAQLQMHHLICDHESLESLLAEVMACVDGREAALAEPAPYRNHVAQALAHAQAHSAEAFFRDKLGDIEETTAPFGLVDVHGDGGQIRQAHEELAPDLANIVRAQARQRGVSPATLFHAAWGLVLAHTCGREDVVFGSLLSGRLQGKAGAQRALGMFINTLPMRLKLQDLTVEQLISHTQRALADLLGYEQASLAEAQRCSGLAGSLPLFSSLLNCLHSSPIPESPGIRVLDIKEQTNYPITIAVEDSSNAFRLTAQTDPRIDPRRITAYMRTAIESLTRALESAPRSPALLLSVLPEEERRQVIEEFNATRRELPRKKLVHELFENQAALTPHAAAVVHEGRVLTYAQLNGKANQLARYLRSRALRPDQLVGLLVERSHEMIVGLLGILKAGSAYLPLDINSPPERLMHMLRDADPRVLLTQGSLKNRLPEIASAGIALDTEWHNFAKYSTENLEPSTPALHPSNLAYVIYTSGSTGVPKGVMIDHAGLLNYLHWALETYAPETGDAVPVNTPLAFDATVTSLYCPLLRGRAVVLLSERHEIEGLEELLQQKTRWSLIKISPAHLHVLGQRMESSLRASVGAFVIGGEALAPSTVELWQSIAPQTRLINEYGPTETVVGCATYEFPGNFTGSLSVPIGRPIANTQIYVLDQRGQPVPIGVAGEIFIGGAGVARGYLNQPGLTEERFLSNPFTADAHARMYKSGDLGRWRPDGTLEYLGRNDSQVKIRGFRIELGEIEAQLARHDAVSDAIVLAREDAPGEKRLVAYVVTPDAVDSACIENLRSHLRSVLPDYMVPNAFVLLDRFPLTANGKLDRRALPAPDLGFTTVEHEAPRDELEETLADIWQKLLHVAPIGRSLNFFEAGGHSLLAMQVLARIRAALRVEVSMRSLFQYPTIEQLAAHIKELRRADLLQRVSVNEADIDHLLEQVVSMPESMVQELMQEMRTEGLQ